MAFPSLLKAVELVRQVVVLARLPSGGAGTACEYLGPRQSEYSCWEDERFEGYSVVLVAGTCGSLIR